jgi:hypothetical protein
MRFYKIKYSQCLYFLLHSKEESAVTSGRHGGEQFCASSGALRLLKRLKKMPGRKN